MNFDYEENMYDIIKNWLRYRLERPCRHVLTEFYYDYADRSRIADVMGLYREQGQSCFVGVEVKLYKKDLGAAVRQARRLQSFCHEVYVAIPKEQFNEMTDNERDDYLNLLYSNQVGLLLVKKRGVPDVRLETRPTMFRSDRYNRAIEYFREFFEVPEKTLSKGVLDDELCEMVLDDFQKTSLYDTKEFLDQDWWYNYDAGSSWIGSDYGYISIENHRVQFNAKVSEPTKAAEKFSETPEQMSKMIASNLKRLNAPVDWNKRGLVKSPHLEVYYTRRGLWYPPKSKKFLSASIDLGILTNDTMAFALGEFLLTRSIHRMYMVGELSRKVLVMGGGVTETRHYAEDLRDFFEVLFKIARELDS